MKCYAFRLTARLLVTISYLRSPSCCVAEDAMQASKIFVADANNARETLGWAPKRSDLATIIADALRWHGKRFA